MSTNNNPNISMMISSDQQRELESLCEQWKTNVSSSWDSLMQDIPQQVQLAKQAKEQSLQARKQLTEHTKQLKKQVKQLEASSTNMEFVKDTVKAYQQEIDSLTKRCKAAETNYSNIAQLLLQLPNPLPIVQQVLQQLEPLPSTALEKKTGPSSNNNNNNNTSTSSSQDERIRQLEREIQEYELEFRQLKNQDITIRKLEQKIQQLESQEQSRMQKEQQSQEQTQMQEHRVQEALEREAIMERKVQQLEVQLKAEKAGRQASQQDYLQENQGIHQRELAWEAQKQILVDDANHLRESLHLVTRERDELRLRVEATASSTQGAAHVPTELSPTDVAAERKAYEAEVAELAETAKLLRNELQSKEEAFVSEQRNFQQKLDVLEREKRNLTTSLLDLQSQLEAAPNQDIVESMKRELRILKRLEYNADMEDDNEPEVAGLDEEKGLEAVLVGKLRRAESDLVVERNAKNDLAREVESFKASLSDALKAKDEAERLVSSLERDLEKAVATPVKQGRKQMDSESVPLVESDPSTLESVLDPTSPPPPPKSAPPVSHTQSASERANDDHSVATIVMAQRDRLRVRCEALEAERDSFKRELQVQVQNSESLKTDNAKLYEKVRYLQNYSKGPTGPKARIRTDDDLDLEALEQRYEASVDPFRQFSKAERQRKLNEMSPIERTVFIIAKTVLCKYVTACTSLVALVLLLTVPISHSRNADRIVLLHVRPPLPCLFDYLPLVPRRELSAR